MPPVVGMDVDQDSVANDDGLYFEASILHRIPPKLAMPISASSILSSEDTFEQHQTANGQSRQSLLLKRKKIHDGRLRKLAKFQAELRGTEKLTQPKELCQDSETEDEYSSISSNSNSSSDSDDNDNYDDNNEDGNIRNEINRKKELLINVILRTMVLTHYNRQFQNTVTALQNETKKFVQSYRMSNNNAVRINNDNNKNNNHLNNINDNNNMNNNNYNNNHNKSNAVN